MSDDTRTPQHTGTPASEPSELRADATTLRKRAEQLLEELGHSDAKQPVRQGEVEDLLHELNVYHVELEMQNEELQRSESALVSSRDYLQELFDHSPLAYLVVDAEGYILSTNSMGEEMFGIYIDGLSGKKITPFLIPQYKTRFLHMLTRVLESGERADTELRCMLADSRPHWVRAHASRIRHQASDRPAILIAVEDITERKHYENNLLTSKMLLEKRVDERTRELQDANTQLKTEMAERTTAQARNRRWAELFRRTELGVVVIDPDGLTIEMANPAYARLHNATIDDLTGRPVSDLYSPDIWEEARAQIQRVMDKGHHMYETVRRRLDGTTYPATVDATAVRDESGRVEYIVANVQDATDRIESQRELVRAKEMAEAASRSKSEFLANMSHEIRTPLNGVLGMLQLLELTELDERQKEYADNAMSSCKGLLTVINDILDFSKIEAGKTEILAEEVDLHGVLSAVVGLFVNQAQAAGIKLSFELDENIPECLLGDAGRLRQILFNLVGNAIKFTEAGEVEVQVRPVNEDPARGVMEVQFMVRDTGIGIPPERLEDIFKPFTQVEGAYTKRFQGTGLGLGIVRKLAALMGGEVAVTSEVGTGSRFFVTLPFTQPLQATCSTVRGRTKQESEEVPGTSKGLCIPDRLRVLLAEDNKVNQMFTQHFLEMQGCEVTSASNGEEAVAAYKDNPVDVVLMDIQMPVMDGLQATQAIRELDNGGTKVPIIAMTAYAMKGDAERFLQKGLDDYISKPVDVSELVRVLQRNLIRSGEDD